MERSKEHRDGKKDQRDKNVIEKEAIQYSCSCRVKSGKLACGIRHFLIKYS